MALESRHFRDNARVQSAANNSPAMRVGEQGEAVARLQEALIEFGILMPQSTQGGKGPADGIFGPETQSAVTQFQTRMQLSVDGIAGKQTFAALDEFMLQQERRPSPQVDTSRWAMTTARNTKG